MNKQRREDCHAYITKDTSEIREFFNPRITRGCHNLSLAEATLYPGKSTEAHHHPQSEEVYYFLSGTGELEVDGARAEVCAGDAILIPAGARHQCRNTGNAPLTFLCHCAPAYTHEDTIINES